MNCLRKLSVKVCLHKLTTVPPSTTDLAPEFPLYIKLQHAKLGYADTNFSAVGH